MRVMRGTTFLFAFLAALAVVHGQQPSAVDAAFRAFWDADAEKWTRDDQYAPAFKEGVAVAKKLRAPEMLIVPLPAPKQARS